MRLRYVLFPAAFAIGVPVCMLAPSSFILSSRTQDGWIGIGLLVALIYVLLAFASATGVVVFAIIREWYKAACCLVLPMFALGFAFYPTALQYLAIGDYLRFAFSYLQYDRAVSAIPQTAFAKMAWFFWRDSMGSSGETLEYLVFDQSDEFALPAEKRSTIWRLNVSRTYPGIAASDGTQGVVHHIFGHYYTVYVDD